MESRDSGAVLQTVENLSRILERQLGCRLSYTPLAEFARMDHLRALLTKGEPVTVESSIYFPVFFHDELAGAAHIITTKDIQAKTLHQVHSVIRLMIENRLSQIEHLELLLDLESQLLKQQEIDRGTKKGNVYALQDYRNNPFPLPENKINASFNFAFLLQSQDQEDLFKMALELHARSGRYAFLPFRDLSPSALESSQSFKSLGPITVFLSDVTVLTKEQQKILLDYYRSARDKDCPQIIAGTAVNPAQLKTDGRVLPDLLQFLSVGFLAMNKPFAIYKQENLLDFFFDSLTGRTST